MHRTAATSGEKKNASSSMKWTHYITDLILAMTFMAGCSHASQTPLLTAAEAFLPAEPDSADARLKQVDVRQLRGDEEEAWYALLRTMTDALQRKQPLNDTLVNRAYNFYRHQSKDGTSSDQALVKHFALSAMYMGDWYAANDSIKASEDCYRQAIKYSEKAEDWHTCYIAYSCLAEQENWGSPEEAMILIEKALLLYDRCQDNVRNLISLYEYAANYSAQIAYKDSTSFQKALDYAFKAYQLAIDSCLTDLHNTTHEQIAQIYWLMGNYQKALEFVQDIHLEELESNASLTTNLRIAQYYLSCDSILKAKQLYESPNVITNKTLAYLYARGLSEVAVHQQNKDSILFYMDSAFTASEAMFLDALQTKDDYFHDNLEKEKENERLIYKDKLKTWIFGGAIFMILLSGLLIGRVLILRIRMQRTQRRNSIMQRKYELERNIEEKRRVECEMQLLREQHEREEEEAKHLQHEMELLQDRQQALEDSQQKRAAVIKHLQKYIIERSDITTKLKDGASAHQMTPKDWQTVEQLLDEIDEGRISKIRERYKDISKDDIRLCVMVRIGLSNPAIGHIFGITPSAVQHRKLTLKKKGFGVADPEVTLDKFLESL